MKKIETFVGVYLENARGRGIQPDLGKYYLALYPMIKTSEPRYRPLTRVETTNLLITNMSIQDVPGPADFCTSAAVGVGPRQAQSGGGRCWRGRAKSKGRNCCFELCHDH